MLLKINIVPKKRENKFTKVSRFRNCDKEFANSIYSGIMINLSFTYLIIALILVDFVKISRKRL